ncbi:hypothetical protein [Rhodococcus sp. ARC_M6]|uniref:hypothetical protein n=1 Tax=Rhodococcus sp. ARC_M6 TaxID=2928852 RepID=UPI001FB36348|nr:hypothetical protein [Rhodococcus sp. ARC_M6]MCJ0907413.1 hypothetical protein [Rhodococcus sp. ARC_M6]
MTPSAQGNDDYAHVTDLCDALTAPPESDSPRDNLRREINAVTLPIAENIAICCRGRSNPTTISSTSLASY